MAALGVVDVHSRWALVNHGFDLEKPQGLSALGSVGVDVFFVISGFVIFFSFIKKASSPSKFIVNRLIRVVPMYWVFTGLLLVVSYLSQVTTGTTPTFAPLHLIESMFFLSQTLSGKLPFLSQGWSLEVELLFYLLFTVSLTFKNKTLRGIAPIATLLILVCLGAVPNLLLEFLFGGAIAYLLSRRRSSSLAAIICGGLGVALLAASGCITFAESERLIYWGIPSSLIVFAAVNLPQAKWAILAKLGSASYAVYLSHTFSVEGIVRLGNFSNLDRSLWPLALVAALVASEFLGLTIYRFVDKPTNSFLRSRALPRWSTAQE